MTDSDCISQQRQIRSCNFLFEQFVDIATREKVIDSASNNQNSTRTSGDADLDTVEGKGGELKEQQDVAAKDELKKTTEVS